MSNETILELLRARPFIPFEMRMSSGDVYQVRHPELAALSKTNLVITSPDSDRIITCVLRHIANVHKDSDNSTNSASPKMQVARATKRTTSKARNSSNSGKLVRKNASTIAAEPQPDRRYGPPKGSSWEQWRGRHDLLWGKYSPSSVIRALSVQDWSRDEIRAALNGMGFEEVSDHTIYVQWKDHKWSEGPIAELTKAELGELARHAGRLVA